MREAHENNSDSAVSRAREQIIEILEILRVGERLPGERELARRIGVARMTLRRAIEGLIADGFWSADQDRAPMRADRLLQQNFA